MSRFYCEICADNVKVSNKRSRIPDPKMFFFLCENCQKNREFVPEIDCCGKYDLIKGETENLRKLYFENINNSLMFFLETDIEDILETKYGSNCIYIKKLINTNTNIKKNNTIKKRRKKLIKELKLHKLEYKKHGDCFSYIHFGFPDIREVIDNELHKMEERIDRMYNLATTLSVMGRSFNEKNQLHIDYINNSTSLSTHDIVRIMNNKKQNNNNITISFDDQ